MDALGVADGDVEGAQDDGGAREINVIAHYGVDGFHERDLDGFLIFDECDGVNAGSLGSGHAADHALVEVAEVLRAQCGRGAFDSVDFDVGAETNVWIDGHKVDTWKTGIPFG